MKAPYYRCNTGFTLLELLVTIPLGLMIIAGIYRTFKAQQDSYIVQDQVAAMQQNLRGAMYLITRDLLMAGFYTNLDKNSHTLNWDDRSVAESRRALIIAGDNISVAEMASRTTRTSSSLSRRATKVARLRLRKAP